MKISIIKLKTGITYSKNILMKGLLIISDIKYIFKKKLYIFNKNNKREISELANFIDSNELSGTVKKKIISVNRKKNITLDNGKVMFFI